MIFTSKRGQLTLFIILAIILVAGVAGFFIFKNYSGGTVPKKVSLVYDSYLNCIDGITKEGVAIIGSSGGYIELPDFEAGSDYMPFSSQLNFLGTGVPYWFYVSGNNLIREKVPTLRSIEEQLENYIGNNIQRCDFSDFEDQGYLIDVDRGSVQVRIRETQIDVELDNEIRILFEEDFSRIKEHSVRVNSKIGRFYSLAKNIYQYQKENLFLEFYGLDVLQLYAPTTGVDLKCSPTFFNFQEIKKNLSEAISNNLPYIKLKGSYHQVKDENYFVKDIGVSVKENVNFLYSTDWPTKIEIYGDEFAQPVGLQEGLGALGFCYVPYHLVYDMNFPVLIQIFDEKETFQFPVSVIIRKNQPREAVYSGEYLDSNLDVCGNRIQELKVSSYDIYLNPVEADISISCLNSGCSLGRTEISGGEASLIGLAPPCINAIVSASAEGYSRGSAYISTNEEDEVSLVLKKKYSVPLDLGNVPGDAIVRFDGDDYSASVAYPEQKSVELVEGFYNISVFVFGDASLVLPSYTEKKCFNVPSSGIGGLFGSEEERCFETLIPEQTIEGALIGGGNAVDYFVEDDLKNARKLNINVPLFGNPSELEDLTENYIKLEDSFVEIEFIK